MDVNSLRYLLIALAGSLAICVNVPWRHTAKSLRRGICALVAPRDFAAWPKRARPGRLANLPWDEIARGRQVALVPASHGSSRLYEQTRARATN